MTKEEWLKKKRGFETHDKTSKPRYINKLESWEMYLQFHNGKKSKEHFDLRLWDPKKRIGHSWAMRKFPTHNEKVVTHQARPHTYEAFNEQHMHKVMKGNVQKMVKDKVKVLKASPGSVVFKMNDDKVFTLKKVNDKVWIFRNSKQNDSEQTQSFEGKHAKEFRKESFGR